jgi:hypothetical protein
MLLSTKPQETAKILYLSTSQLFSQQKSPEKGPYIGKEEITIHFPVSFVLLVPVYIVSKTAVFLTIGYVALGL